MRSCCPEVHWRSKRHLTRQGSLVVLLEARHKGQLHGMTGVAGEMLSHSKGISTEWA